MTSPLFIKSALRQFRMYKGLGDRSFSRLTEEQLHAVPAPESNSIAIIIRHMHGNMLSRWTDFLDTDGEKPWRQRDSEFEDADETKAALLEKWETGWSCVFQAIEPLSESDLARTVTIRQEAMTVTEAIDRQVAHYAYHVGQIVYIAKMMAGENWETLSMPKRRRS